LSHRWLAMLAAFNHGAAFHTRTLSIAGEPATPLYGRPSGVEGRRGIFETGGQRSTILGENETSRRPTTVDLRDAPIPCAAFVSVPY
jgi:hypothetical protein